VHLVEVDDVDAQTAQAGVAGAADAVGLQPLPAGVRDREAHLRGHDDLVAAAREPRREGGLRGAVAVGVGRVEQVAARREVRVEHPLGLAGRRPVAHEHRAQRQA
jgi:hypothetical protein